MSVLPLSRPQVMRKYNQTREEICADQGQPLEECSVEPLDFVDSRDLT